MTKIRFKISHRGRTTKRQPLLEIEKRGDKDRKPAPKKRRK